MTVELAELAVLAVTAMAAGWMAREALTAYTRWRAYRATMNAGAAWCPTCRRPLTVDEARSNLHPHILIIGATPPTVRYTI